MAKPWSGAGAWAAEAEQAEAEAKAAGNNSGGRNDAAFPSLGETMVSAKGAKKKNKPQTFSISEFTVGAYVGPGGKNRAMSNTRGLSADEMMMLPTGPRDRTNEDPEPYGGIGGGFKDYGGFRGGGDRMGSDRGDRFGGGFDRDRDRDDRRGDRMGRDRDGDYRDDLPSRADEAESWGANKKAPSQLPLQGSGPGDRMGRGGYEDNVRDRGRISDRDLPSRADEVDTWTKKSVPTPQFGGGGDNFDRRGSRGGGFEDMGRRSGGFDDGPGQMSRADGADSWSEGKKFVPSAGPERRGGFESSYRDAGSDAERWARRELPPRGDDAPRPAERPRLVLQPRTVPVDNSLPLPVDRNGENERPHSSHSTRSASTDNDSLDTTNQQPPPKPRPRSNPFGSARPREEVLAEKGQDWRKLDAELETKRPSSSHSNRSSRPQTPEVGPGESQRSRPKPNPFGEAKPRDTGREQTVADEESPKASEDATDRPSEEQAEYAEQAEHAEQADQAEHTEKAEQAEEKSVEQENFLAEAVKS